MGKISARLAKLFDKAFKEKVISLMEMSEAKKIAAENIKTMPSFQKLIDKGHDPIHAIYTNTLNLISIFQEQVTTLPPLHSVHDFISKWLDLYMPGLPPMSPITNSFFTCWVMFDVTFGVDKETVGTYFLALTDKLQLHPVQIEAAKNLEQSRMGIYKVLQTKGQFFQLRELITDKLCSAFICSGYRGKIGDLIYLRLVPPLSNTADYFVGLTTPYLLAEHSENAWLEYFKRQDIIPNTVGVETRLHRHMKYGVNPTYWSEYVFYGYSNAAAGVIMLSGYPDQPETQPQHKEYQAPHLFIQRKRDMTVAPYQPCPCGSGKKYKFCCRDKEKV